MYVYSKYDRDRKLNKIRRKFFGRRTRECRDIIVFPKRRTRIIITKHGEEKEDNKNIILCFLLFNAKQVIHVPAVAFVPRRAHRDIFNNNSSRPFADTPLKSLEITQEGRDGEGDAKMKYKVS